MKVKRSETNSILDDLLSWSDGYETAQCVYGVREWDISAGVKERIAAIVEGDGVVCIVWHTRPSSDDEHCYAMRVLDKDKAFEQLIFIDGELIEFGETDTLEYETFFSDVYSLLGVKPPVYEDNEPW